MEIELTCEVCKTRKAIGVASTSQPYSCPYCEECARAGADPEWIFEYLLKDVAGGDPEWIREGLTTYYNGEYISFHEWCRRKHAQTKSSSDSDH